MAGYNPSLRQCIDKVNCIFNFNQCKYCIIKLKINLKSNPPIHLVYFYLTLAKVVYYYEVLLLYYHAVIRLKKHNVYDNLL